jgi:hypothetical protein
MIALGALCLAGCAGAVGGDGAEEPGLIPSWESYLASATQEVEGRIVYLVDGDIPVSLAELRADYDRRVAETRAALRGESTGIGSTEQPSTVNQIAGVDNLWATGLRRDLTYCITDDFGALKARTIAEMAQATADWERHGNFNFRYVPAEDGACDNTNPDVLFAVRPWTGSGACAFFPAPSDISCVPRTLVMNYGAFASGPVTSLGVFRHELGHVLGLRHEHIRAPGTFCTEDTSWRAVTDYDSSSVMHYPTCPGSTNTGDLLITPGDAAGIRSLYGPSSAHGFAWVSAAGGVSPLYAYNSAGGPITATLGPTGSYTVTFSGLGGTGGDAQVVAYGGGNARCKVGSWGGAWPGDLSVNVRCHLPDPAGTAVASAFVVQYARKNVTVDGNGAYVWANSPASASYEPSKTYSWNSSEGVNRIDRNGPGDYSVLLPGLGVAGGTFQVTAYGSGAAHCKIQYWFPSGTTQVARVLCFGPGGPADSTFALQFFGDREVSVFDYGGYAWAHDPTSPGYTLGPPYSYDSGYIDGWPGCVGWGGTITGGKIGADTGHYFLRYQNLSPTHSAAHATSYGASPSYCKIEGWFTAPDGGTEVRARCFGASGEELDSQYVGTYASSLLRGPC